MSKAFGKIAASHAGEGRRRFAVRLVASSGISNTDWATGVLDPPRTARVKHAVAHPHVESIGLGAVPVTVRLQTVEAELKQGWLQR